MLDDFPGMPLIILDKLRSFVLLDKYDTFLN